MTGRLHAGVRVRGGLRRGAGGVSGRVGGAGGGERCSGRVGCFISRVDSRRAQEALHRIADVVAAKDPFDVLDDVRVPVNDELAVDVGFAVRVSLADLGPVTVGVSEDELELRHDSPLAHPGAVAGSGQGERRAVAYIEHTPLLCENGRRHLSDPPERVACKGGWCNGAALHRERRGRASGRPAAGGVLEAV